MPRPKGSKNKKRMKRSVRLRLPDSTLDILNRLSEDSGLPFLKVLDDSAIEGASELRSETYKGLIEFNQRRGKLVHERELYETAKNDQEHAPESAGNNDPLADQAGPADAAFERGHQTENRADSGVAAEDFQRRAQQTLEHIANHPPFTGSFNVPDFSVPSGDEPESVG